MSAYLKPSIDELRRGLRVCGSPLADGPIEYLDAGWDFWVFSAGDHILRCPQSDWYMGRLDREEALMKELAPILPVPVPVPSVICPEGPNGHPVSGYRRVPGIALNRLRRPPASSFGADLGRVLRALHNFPVNRAVEIGLEFVDGPKAKSARISKYAHFARNILPLLTSETRTHVARVVEMHINNEAEYDFEPRLSHGDIDDRNVLADPETGKLAGVIDFLDADIHSPVGDFTWAYCGGFAQLGIEDQLPELLREGGLDEHQLEGRCDFVPVWFALQDVLHGIEIKDDDFVTGGLRKLNELTPPELRC